MTQESRKQDALYDELRASKIFPRNLPAQSYRLVVGNPVSSRLESGVGNDYPGLEFDHRNLDRRFFPGLVVDFVAQSDTDTSNLWLRGIRLTAVDPDDPDLVAPIDPKDPDFALRSSGAATLAGDLNGDPGQKLSKGVWFVNEIEQDGVSLLTYKKTNGEVSWLDGLVVWYFVRGLEPGKPVRIKLGERHNPADSTARPTSAEITLHGWRRRFTDYRTGAFPDAYAPGELTQSLCSPWQHDFRDCACNYWAANHPDIVLTEDPPGASLLPTGGSGDPRRANEPVDWLRADRNLFASAEAGPTRADNRPYQMDHYEINRRWQQLSIVLEGKEVSHIYRPGQIATANPYETPGQLGQALVELATLEHVLILEYLYAYFSIAPETQVNEGQFPGITTAVIFARHELLFIAVSEMRHLRWANQIIWQLEHLGLIPPDTGPSLGVAATVPGSLNGPERPRELRLLTPDVLKSFIDVEAPSGSLDGKYARVSATLRKQPYPDQLAQLADRIIADGVEHFSRFREIRSVLQFFNPPKPNVMPPYLLSLTPAAPDDPKAMKALQTYKLILEELKLAYRRGDMEDAQHIVVARQAMAELEQSARRLASEGLGVPFF